MPSELPRLFLARHGDTAWTDSRQHTGRTDLPLNEARGGARPPARRAAAAVLLRPRLHQPVAAASRTCELAGFGAVARGRSGPGRVGLRPLRGDADRDILKERPGWELFRDGCPEGESPEDVAARADRFIARVRGIEGDVLAFSSGHIIRMIAARWLGLPPAPGGSSTAAPPASACSASSTGTGTSRSSACGTTSLNRGSESSRPRPIVGRPGHGRSATRSEVVMTIARAVRRASPRVPPPRPSAEARPWAPPSSTGGVNFSLFSRTAAGVELLFFDREDDAAPSRVVRIDPATNRTYHYWHVFVPGVRPGQIYGYRVEGPSDPASGLRFDSDQGPARPVRPRAWSSRRATTARPRSETGDNAATAMKSVVVDPARYDWEGDLPLRRPSVTHHHLRDARPRVHAPPELRRRREDARHVRRADREDPVPPANSASPPSSCCRCSSSTPRTARRAWSTTGASSRSRSSRRTRRTARASDPLGPVDEFRDMVKALHRAGIEVILDVVFNHTAEGDHDGPTLCFRGIDNPTYYILEQGGVALRRLHRLRQHAQRQPPDRPPDDRGQPALLGRGDARRRLPLRPRVDPGPRLRRAIRCRTRRCSGTSSRTRRWPAPS